MNVELAVAGLCCAVLAFGHATVGLRWVLPNLRRGSLPSTPFGAPSMTLGMVRFTWHMVTVVLVAFAALFLMLSWVGGTDPRTLLLRWFTAFWLAATAVAFWNARRRLSSLLRLPVPFLFVVIAAMSWKAST
ncbi:MAG TPA: hypothetical protein VJQ08_10760 [Candidatus Dormibacteraeota bacterium]|nr:hypothetical protein [Candidatus Dormibacteraeota bacterium]